MKKTFRFHVPLLAMAFAGSLFLSNEAAAQVLYVAQNEFNGTSGDGIISTVSSGGTVTPFADVGSGISVYGLAFDNSGTLYAAVAGSADYAIDKITSGGAVSTLVDFGSSGTPDPVSLTYGPDGNLYASNYSFLPPGSVYKVTTGGSSSVFTNAIPDGANGLAFDQSGNLYVASGNSNIYKVTPGGTVTTFATGLNGSYALAFDQSGYLYSGNLFDNSISKISPDGTTITSFVAGGTLGHMEGLAFDSQGNLLVANGSSISKVTSGGTVSTVATGLTNPNAVAFSVVPEPSTSGLVVVGIIASLLIGLRRQKAVI